MRDSSNNVQGITAGVMTGTTVINGKAMGIRGMKAASYQAVWTGTPTGVFDFMVSNIPGAVKDGVADITKFTALTSPAAFTAKQPAGAAGAAVFGFADLAQVWILPRYTNASGTGSCDVYGEAC